VNKHNDRPEKEQPEKAPVWPETLIVNLVRYKPSRVYFARFRIKRKLIRRSLRPRITSPPSKPGQKHDSADFHPASHIITAEDSQKVAGISEDRRLLHETASAAHRNFVSN
jgi:hypothetical protein